MPEDLEPRAAPSDSLVGLLAIAEGLSAPPLLGDALQTPEVLSLVDHYISGDPNSVAGPALPASQSAPQTIEAATLSAATVDAVVQTETTIAGDAVLPNFDPTEALRQQADAMADHLANQLPAGLGSFPIDDPGDGAPTGGGSAGIGAGCALLAAASEVGGISSSFPMVTTTTGDGGAAPVLSPGASTSVPAPAEGTTPPGGIPPAPAAQTEAPAPDAQTPAPAPHGKIQPVRLHRAPPGFAASVGPAVAASAAEARSAVLSLGFSDSGTPYAYDSSGQMYLFGDSGGSGGENQPPVANPDQYSVDPAQGSLSVAAPGVLGNDTDPDGPSPTHAVLASTPDAGSLTLHDDGSFEFTPPAVWSGVSFTYYANDGSLNSVDAATVTISGGGGSSETPTVEILAGDIDTYELRSGEDFLTGDPALFTVTRSGSTGQDITVHFTYTGDAADYYGDVPAQFALLEPVDIVDEDGNLTPTVINVTLSGLYIPAGQSSVPLNIQALHDNMAADPADDARIATIWVAPPTDGTYQVGPTDHQEFWIHDTTGWAEGTNPGDPGAPSAANPKKYPFVYYVPVHDTPPTSGSGYTVVIVAGGASDITIPNPDPLKSRFSERDMNITMFRASYPLCYIYNDVTTTFHLIDDVIATFPDGSINLLVLAGHGTRDGHVGIQPANNNTLFPDGYDFIDDATITAYTGFPQTTMRTKLAPGASVKIATCGVEGDITGARALATWLQRDVTFAVGILHNVADGTSTVRGYWDSSSGEKRWVEGHWETAHPNSPP